MATTVKKAKALTERERQQVRRELVLRFVEVRDLLGELLMDAEEAALAGAITAAEARMAENAVEGARDELECSQPPLTPTK